MDRRTLISGALGGAAGIVVGREVAPSAAGAAADVDRSEFDALVARVAYLEGFHPPMPTPKFSGVVSIPAGFVVPFGEVWDFDPDVSTTVECGANVVVAGTLQMRPANPGVVHTLRFVGINEANVIGGGMEPVATDVGLWVIGAGVLDAVGSAKTSWTHAAGTVAQGASQVQLVAAPDGWQAGDTITVVPTAVGKWDQYDTATVTVSGATANLSAPTVYAHPAVTVGPGFTMSPEVLNLTRNVIIEGTPTGRAHVFINSSVPQHLAHVEIRYMGPRKVTTGPYHRGILGRYPLHFHMCGDGSRGSTVTNVVVHDSGHRAFVPHDSHGISFVGCVAHNVFDEPYWWDPSPAATHDVVWDSCVASNVQVWPPHQGYRLSGFQLGIGNNNTCVDCVAVGIQGNVNANGFHWPEGPTASVWTFARGITHNNKAAGMFVWHNNGQPHLVEDFVIYHCSGEGIQHGAYGNSYVYRNGWVYGCKIAQMGINAVAYGTVSPVFERLHMDAAGQSASVIAAAHHNGTTTYPTRYQGCTLIGSTGPTYVVRSIPAGGKTDYADFVECGPVTVLFEASAPPASVTRVQNAGAATSNTPAGSTSIAPFSTWTGAAPTPFAVKQSA